MLINLAEQAAGLLPTGSVPSTVATKAGIQSESYTYATDTGTANAYAITLSPAPSLVAGSTFSFKAANSCTGSSTITINSGSAITIKQNGNSTNTSTGSILANQIIDCTYDGTYAQIIVPGSGAVSSITTTGQGGPATLSSGVLNIPQYTGFQNGICTLNRFVNRATSTVFQNTGSYPILIVGYDGGGSTTIVGYTDSSSTPTTVVFSMQVYSGASNPVAFLVMPSNYYKITSTNSPITWSEYTFNTGSWSASGDLVGTRALSTNYQNTGTGFMLVEVTGSGTSSGTTLSVFCDSTSTPSTQILEQTTLVSTISAMFIVPPSYYYKVTQSAGSNAHWNEYSSGIACTRLGNLFSSPAIRAITLSTASPPAVYSFFNNTGKCKFVQTTQTATATGTNQFNCDPSVPPISTMQASSGTSGMFRTCQTIQMPGEFLYSKSDNGSPTADYWFEYILG